MAFIYMVIHGHPYELNYNCSHKNLKEWYTSGSKELILRSYFWLSGMVMMVRSVHLLFSFSLLSLVNITCFQSLYVLCLISMLKNKLLKTPGFKIVFLGFIDISSIFVNSVITGYLAIIGTVYCTHTITLLYIGALGIINWIIININKWSI
uniref:DUF418 domain-containing protein n=1 Tax=Heterorhabditis bacteriophora TaxID=37862 RepID=A0A1I7WHP7_HETBA